jgi:hypothetical protein
VPGRAAECQLELPSVTGDVAFVLWLLIRGAKEQIVNGATS